MYLFLGLAYISTVVYRAYLRVNLTNVTNLNSYQSISRDLKKAIYCKTEMDISTPAVCIQCESIVAERINHPVIEENQRFEEQTPVSKKVKNIGFGWDWNIFFLL